MNIPEDYEPMDFVLAAERASGRTIWRAAHDYLERGVPMPERIQAEVYRRYENDRAGAPYEHDDPDDFHEWLAEQLDRELPNKSVIT